MIPGKRVVVLYLSLFGKTGGIERFNRSFSKALYSISNNNAVYFYALYDDIVNNKEQKYIPNKSFEGLGDNKVKLISRLLSSIFSTRTIIVGHINFAPLLILFRYIFPHIKFVLITHGIEVWRDLGFFQKKFLKNVHFILTVSNHTKNILIKKHGIDQNKITVFPNTIDPFFDYPSAFRQPEYIRQRYDFKPSNKIVFTLTRLSSTEHFKGYDKVIKSIIQLQKTYPDLAYLIGGKADDKEYQRLTSIIKASNAESYIKLCGFITETELTDHYLASDVFIIPSKKEGFGIVFIEAMACGLQVIAGNQDGSVDALKNGELGILINPDEEKEISNAIEKSINNIPLDLGKKQLQERVRYLFGFNAYQLRLKEFMVNNRLIDIKNEK